MLLQLLMEGRKIRQHVFGKTPGRLPVSEQHPVEAGLVPLLWEGADDSCRGGFTEILVNGALTDGTSTGNRPLPQPQLEAKAKHFSDLAHGQSPGRHLSLPL